MDDNIQNYRQPMVTAIGIILGFILGFIGKWATEPVDETTLADYIVSSGLFICVIMLMMALFRILNNAYPSENVANYYKATLRIFIIGLSAAFVVLIIAVFQAITGN